MDDFFGSFDLYEEPTLTASSFDPDNDGEDETDHSTASGVHGG